MKTGRLLLGMIAGNGVAALLVALGFLLFSGSSSAALLTIELLLAIGLGWPYRGVVRPFNSGSGQFWHSSRVHGLACSSGRWCFEREPFVDVLSPIYSGIAAGLAGGWFRKDQGRLNSAWLLPWCC